VFIIIIRKLSKPNYTDLKVYKLIALFNILNKALKTIIAKKVYFLIKIYALLPSTQIKVKKQQSINIILYLLFEKIYTI
jgi:hypothetical protein